MKDVLPELSKMFLGFSIFAKTHEVDDTITWWQLNLQKIKSPSSQGAVLKYDGDTIAKKRAVKKEKSKIQINFRKTTFLNNQI